MAINSFPLGQASGLSKSQEGGNQFLLHPKFSCVDKMVFKHQGFLGAGEGVSNFFIWILVVFGQRLGQLIVLQLRCKKFFIEMMNKVHSIFVLSILRQEGF